MTDIECWAPIPGYENHYEVSNIGQVRSLSRVVLAGNRGGGRKPIRLRGKLLRPSVGRRDGQMQVGLSNGGVRTVHRIGRLVLLAFVGPCPPALECCHENDIPTDNRLVNLRWGTPSSNIGDQVRNGNHNQARKTHCTNGHEFTRENTATSTSGGRYCRACNRDATRRRRASFRPVVTTRDTGAL